MNWLARVALVLVIIGALNWLLVGVFQWDLVAALFGGNTLRDASMLSRVVYTLVDYPSLLYLFALWRQSGYNRLNIVWEVTPRKSWPFSLLLRSE